jgi:hypothetical protein
VFLSLGQLLTIGAVPAEIASPHVREFALYVAQYLRRWVL